MNKPFYIYVLRDPRNNAIRYVGFTTKTLEERLSGHISDRRDGTHKANWLLQLYRMKLRPIIQPIFTWDDPNVNWGMIEKNWIRELRNLGWDLTNETDGGEGTSGWKHTKETCEKMSKSARGKIISKETRQKISYALKGHEVLQHTRNKISYGQIGNNNAAGHKNYTKVTQSIVDEIRGRLTGQRGEQTLLANEYGICQQNISCIACNKSWYDPNYTPIEKQKNDNYYHFQ